MTAESIMTSRLKTLHPTDTVAHAVRLMHRHEIRNLPVVDDQGCFIGLFGIRRLSRILLPKAATNLDRYNLTDLSFLPDDSGEMHERLRKAGNRPVSEFLEKKRKLVFCSPKTTFPELLELLDTSSDTSLPVIVVKGKQKQKQLVGIISAWDVLEKVAVEVFSNEPVNTPGHKINIQDVPPQASDR